MYLNLIQVSNKFNYLDLKLPNIPQTSSFTTEWPNEVILYSNGSEWRHTPVMPLCSSYVFTPWRGVLDDTVTSPTVSQTRHQSFSAPANVKQVFLIRGAVTPEYLAQSLNPSYCTLRTKWIIQLKIIGLCPVLTLIITNNYDSSEKSFIIAVMLRVKWAWLLQQLYFKQWY